MPSVTLKIQPQTQVRSVQGDKIYFKIPKDQLRPEGLKRRLRLERYNQYKSDLFDVALEAGFKIPHDEYFHIIFFIPMPRTWRKWKRDKHDMRPHQSKPDKDNLEKAFMDALLKRDQAVYDSRVTKFWTADPVGWIEIHWGEEARNLL